MSLAELSQRNQFTLEQDPHAADAFLADLVKCFARDGANVVAIPAVVETAFHKDRARKQGPRTASVDTIGDTFPNVMSGKRTTLRRARYAPTQASTAVFLPHEERSYEGDRNPKPMTRRNTGPIQYFQDTSILK